MAKQGSPRQTITPDSFSVAPELLGRPLAGPGRRALAMLFDITLIAILIKIGWSALFGVLLVALLLRFGRTRLRTSKALRFGTALVVFILGLTAWNATIGRAFDSADEENDEPASELKQSGNFGDVNVDMSLGQAASLTRLGLGLRSERDPARAQQGADALVAMLKRLGVDNSDMDDLRDAAHEVASSGENDVVRAAIDSAFAVKPAETGSNRDSLTVALAAALKDGTPAHVDSLRIALGTLLARDQIGRLDADLREERGRAEKLDEELKTLKNRGTVRTLLSSVADDLGLGFGWFAFYFTAFLALMRGQTPGKRLLGLRVVRLDAKPIGWWIAFERFGGYFASLTLGLLGFLQILWDRNRQGLHDKAVETVVIRSEAA